MKWQWSLLSLTLLVSTVLAQESPQKTAAPAAGAPAPSAITDSTLTQTSPALFPADGGSESAGGRFSGNHNFDNFIGWMDNPVQNIDPRAVTEIVPIFGSSWFSPSRPLPSGNAQVYGPALSVALSERFCVGLNQGGYAVADFNGRQSGFFTDRFGRIHNRLEAATGQREGWLNTGGFAQYTFYEDVPDQCLATAGMRIEVPIGSKEIFEGNGPAYMSTYLSGGKELGNWHFLGMTGFEFPLGPGTSTTNLFYGNIHIDRQIGWLYPLVEFNWSYHVRTIAVDLPLRRGFLDLDNFSSTGNIVSLAAGADAVIIKNRLEFGAVYTTPIDTQHNFSANGLIVKLVLRY
ncbi:MAG TPA: hypothetical protein VGG61_16220 [Gemmataceae bacterium]|jgi:hypothetical protein